MPLTVADAKRALGAMAETIAAHKEYLTELDSAIGDADHGINMTRGFSKAREKIDGGEYATIGALCKEGAMVGAVEASIGSPVSRVAAVAREARNLKKFHES